MKVNRVVWLLGLTLALAGLTMTVWAQRQPQRNIVQTAVASDQFDTLVTAVREAGLVGTLSGPGPFTVFAPTDSAFAKLPNGTLQSLLQNRAELRAVLTYHVVPGRYTAQQLAGMQYVRTVSGRRLAISRQNGTLAVNGIPIVTPNVSTSNGVIHAIGSVLIPPPAGK